MAGARPCRSPPAAQTTSRCAQPPRRTGLPFPLDVEDVAGQADRADAADATSARPDLLEHPEDAFAEYRSQGVASVVCQEKHMGSRAVAVVCRDAATAEQRFGVRSGETGAVYTRTGRPFFRSPAQAGAVPTDSVPPSPRAACGTSSARDGWCWTASCCRGRPRRWT
ncbi:MAG: hypothetical protein ACRDPC_08830 [Solirubrobacteraceae bacterium]